jgi:site-specific recombinase XerD
LFPGDGDGHVKDLSNAWEEVRKKVALVIPKFKRCRFHDLRHTVGSDLVKAGVPIPVVKEILGHREISTTMRYAHVQQEQLLEAVGRIPVFHRIFTAEVAQEANTAV